MIDFVNRNKTDSTVDSISSDVTLILDVNGGVSEDPDLTTQRSASSLADMVGQMNDEDQQMMGRLTPQSSAKGSRNQSLEGAVSETNAGSTTNPALPAITMR